MSWPATKALRFLALGDSYTVGEGVEAAQTWPFRVARHLRAGRGDVTDPVIVAQTGWTTDELDAAITERAHRLEVPYALVTLLVGVNDQYRGRPVEAFGPPFHHLLRRAIGFAGGDARRVVAVSIPDWGVTPFAADRDRAAVAAAIDAFNAAAQTEAVRAGARWVDITPLSRRQPHLVAADGLHPSGEAYAGWADCIVPEARAALAGRRA